ncbi:MAG: hypothetical protein K8T89_18000, partial [Planctomycetes bacterium]|nr:hypothetical protein [Planctomycetota bacterium]
MKHCILFLGLATSLVALSSGRAQDSEFYKKPSNPPEFWRALQFELSVGKYDIAATHLSGLINSMPKEAELLAIEQKFGLISFLRLRNVERWSRNKEADKVARDQVETLINLVSVALKKELTDPVRITKFAKNLSATPEESAFALKELLRSGIDAIPVLVDLLRENQDAEQRAGILQALPYFDVSVVPAIVASLDIPDATLKLELLESLRSRKDYLLLTSRVETDLIPILWYFSAPLRGNAEPVRKKAQSMLLELLDRDPNADRRPEHRLPQWRLTQAARNFLEHKARFSAPDQAIIWKWDGIKLAQSSMSFSEAEEYYGLRYARWALEIQPEFVEAQRVFLTLALDKHFIRSGPDAALATSSPNLYAVLATAPYDMLAELLEDYLREKRIPMAVSVIQVIGDRTELRAARPSDGATKLEFRSSLLMKALEYPDRRVQFAAVDALLKTPGQHQHQRAALIVKILAGYLQADSPEDAGKARVLIGDADRVRGEALATVARQAGFKAEIVRTGREVMQRLTTKADIDLIIVDQHLPYPMLPDLLAQTRTDLRTANLPLLVVASPDRATTAHPITLLGRLAALVAADEHVDLIKAQRSSEDNLRDEPATRFKKRLDMLKQQVEAAGIVVSADVQDRLEYLVFLTTPSTQLFAPSTNFLVELEKSKLTVPPKERLNRMASLTSDSKRGHIDADDPPFSNSRELTPALAQVVARYEIRLPADVLDTTKVYWRIMQYGLFDKDGKVLQPPLPGVSIRYPEIEERLARMTKGYKLVGVVPEMFSDEVFLQAVGKVAAIQDPKVIEAEKKLHARTAMEWLRKMAIGELTGYPYIDAAPTIRLALQNPELAALAVDVAVRLPGREAQQELAGVVLG